MIIISKNNRYIKKYDTTVNGGIVIESKILEYSDCVDIAVRAETILNAIDEIENYKDNEEIEDLFDEDEIKHWIGNTEYSRDLTAYDKRDILINKLYQNIPVYNGKALDKIDAFEGAEVNSAINMVTSNMIDNAFADKLITIDFTKLSLKEAKKVINDQVIDGFQKWYCENFDKDLDSWYKSNYKALETILVYYSVFEDNTGYCKINDNTVVYFKRNVYYNGRLISGMVLHKDARLWSSSYVLKEFNTLQEFYLWLESNDSILK